MLSATSNDHVYINTNTDTLIVTIITNIVYIQINVKKKILNL